MLALPGFPFGKGNLWFSLADLIAAACVDRHWHWAARHVVWTIVCCANGGPPLVSRWDGSHVAADRPTSGRFLTRTWWVGRALPGGGFRPARVLLGRVVLCGFGAVEDDLLYLTGGVSPRDQLGQVIDVADAR